VRGKNHDLPEASNDAGAPAGAVLRPAPVAVSAANLRDHSRLSALRATRSALSAGKSANLRDHSRLSALRAARSALSAGK